MNKKGFGNEFNKKNNNQNVNFLVEDIELSAQTKKAIFLAREGNFLESAKIYNDLILKGKSNHLTFHRLAGIYEKLGKRKEAFQCLQKAINIKKIMLKPIVILADICRKPKKLKVL